MYEHHDALLHSVRDGVLILSDDGRLLLANDEAIRLLELSPLGLRFGFPLRLQDQSDDGADRGQHHERHLKHEGSGRIPA